MGMVFFTTCAFLVLQGFLLVAGDNAPSKEKTSTPDRKTNVKIQIPNFFNFIPDLDGLFQDFDPETFGLSSNDKEKDGVSQEKIEPSKQIKEILGKAKENYQKVRETLQSTLNSSDPAELFTFDLRSKGPKTKLNINTPLTQFSLDTKSPDISRSGDLPEERTSEVPFREYLNNLISHNVKRFGDISLSIVSTPGDANKDQKPPVGLGLPIAPIKVSVTSDSAFMKRSGWEPQHSRGDDGDDVEIEENYDPDDMDPEEEYRQHIEHQKQKYMDIRARTSMQPPPSYSSALPFGQQFTKQANQFFDILGLQASQMSKQSALNPQQAFMQQLLDPVKRMGERLGISNTKIKNTMSADDHESYDEYIDDLEDLTGSLSVEARSKLRSAFRQFKKSLENVNFGENVDLEKLMRIEPKDKSSWLPRRVIDQRDLEIAFLNIDKESKGKINPNDRVVIAFTLTGVPLKIHVDSNIENPVKFLHKILTDAGVSLNIPVKSFEDMDPVSGEVLFVGGGNDITQAMALEVPNVEDIKTTVRRYLKTKNHQARIGIDSSAEALKAALQDTLTSKKKPNFSEALHESFQRNPVKVLADIVTFLSESPPTLKEKEEKEAVQRNRSPDEN